jgi:type IV pilus assembly protein PilB
MRIGELLIMNGLITDEQLGHALKQQVNSPKKLGEILIDDGAITERQLVEALEFQLGIPAVKMDELIVDKDTIKLIDESVARKHCIFPVEKRGGKIKVAMVDPINQEAIKDIQMTTGMSVQPFIATRTDLEKVIMENYGMSESVGELIEIIELGLEQKAKFIYLDPVEDGLVIKFRINNEVKTHKKIELEKQRAIISRLKTISNLNTAETKIPQDGFIHKQVEGKNFDIRVSTLPTVNGESIHLRIIDQSEKVTKVADLGISERNMKSIEKVFTDPTGLLLVSGPTGSGKTSTLYSLLDHLNNENIKAVTIEEMMEHRMTGVTQLEVNERVGLTFSTGLQSVLRQSPDVVMLGDIPDARTAEFATRGSLAGSLVIASMYGRNAIGAINRLINMGLEPYLIASSIKGVVSQRIVRRICDECAQSVPVSDKEYKLFEAHDLLQTKDQKGEGKSIMGNFRTFVAANISGKMTVVHGGGCRYCNNTGFKGHIGLHEVLTIDDHLRELIIEKKPVKEMEQHLKQNGFKSLLYDGLLKAKEGLTTVEEVLKVIN